MSEPQDPDIFESPPLRHTETPKRGGLLPLYAQRIRASGGERSAPPPRQRRKNRKSDPISFPLGRKGFESLDLLESRPCGLEIYNVGLDRLASPLKLSRKNRRFPRVFRFRACCNILQGLLFLRDKTACVLCSSMIKKRDFSKKSEILRSSKTLGNAPVPM